MASFGMLLPELPGYLDGMGAGHLIGWIVALFTLGAFASRFVSGRLADLAGRKPVMLFGTAVTTLAGFAYIGVARLESVAMAVTGFLVVRLLHGMSTGFRPTGTSAFLTDIVPTERRGEALGYLGVAGNAGMALGPALGSWLAVEWGYDAMFLASSVLGLAAYIMTWQLPETLPNARKVQWGDLNVFGGGVIERAAWPASFFLLPVAMVFGTFLTVTPDLVEGLGFLYKGSFNTVVVVASVATRLVAGKASDKHGRVELMMVGALLLAVGMALFSIATTVPMLISAGVVYGLSVGINMPTIFAWTVDLAPEGKAATALGTMLMALEVGIGLGAFGSGTLYAGNPEVLLSLYGGCAGFGVAGFVFLWAWRRVHKKGGIAG
jgi:MFS family permease